MAENIIDVCEPSEETVLFENVYEADRNYYKEVLGFLNFRSKWFFIFNAFFVAILLIAIPVFSEISIVLRICSIAYIPLFNGFLVLKYLRSVKLCVKRDQETFGDRPRTQTCRVADSEKGIRVLLLNPLYPTSEYREPSIKKVRKTKNYFLLISHTGLVYIFKKGAFTVGDDNGFLAYLQAKGYRVK